MTPVERAEVVRLVRESRAAQGLPPTVEDPVVLRAVARIIARSPVSSGRRLPNESDHRGKDI